MSNLLKHSACTRLPPIVPRPQFATTAPGSYSVTTTSGQTAATAEPIMACGSAIYIVDKVLTPAALFASDFPLTTLEEALAILNGGGAGAPGPAPEPMP